MGKMLNVILFVVIINIVLMGINSELNIITKSNVPDFVAPFVKYDSNFSAEINLDTGGIYENIPKTKVSPTSNTQQAGGTIINAGLIDQLGIVFDLLIFILGLNFAFVAFFFALGMPNFIALIFTVPLLIIYIFAWIQVIRGVDT